MVDIPLNANFVREVNHPLARRRCILWHFNRCLLTGETNCNSNLLWIRKTMLIFAPQLTHTAAQSLCDSWATRFSLFRPNFVVLCLGVHPERVWDRYATFAACGTWRFILIRQMVPLNLRTLSVCHTRDPCVRCTLSLRITELLVFSFSVCYWRSSGVIRPTAGHDLQRVVHGVIQSHANSPVVSSS